MSRDFYFRCLTCDPDGVNLAARWGDGADLNWQDEALLALLPTFELFAQVAEAGFEIDGESLNLTRCSYRPRGLAAYALAHRGHIVQVWDEYGEGPYPLAPSSGGRVTGEP